MLSEEGEQHGCVISAKNRNPILIDLITGPKARNSRGQSLWHLKRSGWAYLKLIKGKPEMFDGVEVDQHWEGDDEEGEEEDGHDDELSENGII